MAKLLDDVSRETLHLKKHPKTSPTGRRPLKRASFLLSLFLLSILLSGCAVALIAGGAAGGYLLAQHVDIKKKEQKKGFFK